MCFISNNSKTQLSTPLSRPPSAMKTIAILALLVAGETALRLLLPLSTSFPLPFHSPSLFLVPFFSSRCSFCLLSSARVFVYSPLLGSQLSSVKDYATFHVYLYNYLFIFLTGSEFSKVLQSCKYCQVQVLFLCYLITYLPSLTVKCLYFRNIQILIRIIPPGYTRLRSVHRKVALCTFTTASFQNNRFALRPLGTSILR